MSLSPWLGVCCCKSPLVPSRVLMVGVCRVGLGLVFPSLFYGRVRNRGKGALEKVILEELESS